MCKKGASGWDRREAFFDRRSPTIELHRDSVVLIEDLGLKALSGFRESVGSGEPWGFVAHVVLEPTIYEADLSEF